MTVDTKYVVLNKITWHCISVYYAKPEWHSLLSFIRLFCLENKELIDSCSLFFSRDQGEHLNIAFTSNALEKEDVSRVIQESFSSFLQNKPSHTLEKLQYGHVLWIDYPNNSLVWNRFHIPIGIFQEPLLGSFVSLTSSLVVELYDEDSSYEENIATILSFFRIRLLKLQMPTIGNITVGEDTALSEFSAKMSGAMEAFDSFWYYSLDEADDLSFLSNWEEKIARIYSQYGYQVGFDKMIQLIYTQLDYPLNTINEVDDLVKVWKNLRFNTDKDVSQDEKISVVIPVYNRCNVLKETLKCVVSQTYKNLEIIVVDDGSEFPPVSVIEELDDKRITLYQIPHQNANAARNYGITHSTGEYIAMLDSDDLWTQTHLADSLKVLKNAGADGVYGSLYLKNRGEKEGQVFMARELAKDESMADYLLTTVVGAQTSTLLTTSQSAKDILWDVRLTNQQDYDFVIRFYKKYKMVPKTTPTTVYCMSDNSLSSTIEYETFTLFGNMNKKDISPMIYHNYNQKMYSLAVRRGLSQEIQQYFRNEATMYKEFISFQEYMKMYNPKNTFSAWIYKMRYVFYLFCCSQKNLV